MNRENMQKFVDLMKLPEFKYMINNMDIKHKYFHVMEAYAKGAEVQLRLNPDDDWEDIELPNFNGIGTEYRVKPARKVVWFRVYKDNNGYLGVWVECMLEALLSTKCLPNPAWEWVTSPACTEVDIPYKTFK